MATNSSAGIVQPGAGCTISGGLLICAGTAANVGVSQTATAPHVSGDNGTGFYSAGAGLLDVAASGTQLVEFSSAGLNLVPLSAGILFNSAVVMHSGNAQYKEDFCAGPRCLSQITFSSTGGNGLVGFGPDSHRYTTNTYAESVAVGAYTDEYGSIFNQGGTYIGEHVNGYDDASYSNGFGNDVFRDTILTVNTDCEGVKNCRDGFGLYGVTAIGQFVMSGSAGFLRFPTTGTPHTGDVYTVTINSLNPDVTNGTSGPPFTTTATAQPGDTIAVLAARLAVNLVSLNITTNVCSPIGHVCDGQTNLTENGVKYEATPDFVPSTLWMEYPQGGVIGTLTAGTGGVSSTNLVVSAIPSGQIYAGGVITACSGTTCTGAVGDVITGPSSQNGSAGTYTLLNAATISTGATLTLSYGWILSFTTSCSGSCGVGSGVVAPTYGGPTGGSSDVFVGQGIFSAADTGSPTQDVILGANACAYCLSNNGTATPSYDILITPGGSQNLLGTDNHDIMLGYGTGNNVSGGNNADLIVIGDRVPGPTTGYSTIMMEVGSSSTQTSCTTTGHGLILIGHVVCPPSPTTSNFVDIADALFVTGASGSGTTAVSALIGLNTNAPDASLSIGAPVANTGAHLDFSQTTLPTITCSGTGSATVNTSSTDAAFQVTEGTASTGCTLTFASAYGVAPICQLSAGTGTAAGLAISSTTTASIVWTNTSATGDVINGICL
jgi:hypothetical protein